MSNLPSPRDFFVAELAKLPSDRALSLSKNAVIRCPWHNGGNERTPSLGINLSDTSKPLGIFKCLACGQSGNWNTLAEFFNLRKLRKGEQQELANTSLFIWNDHVLPPDPSKMAKWPSQVAWRTIPGETLSLFNARSIMFGRQPFLYLPVTVYEEDVGGVQCRIERQSRKETGYINTSGTWVRTALLGFDVARTHRTDLPLWVVEGPRDCLSIWAKGGRAVAILGTNNLSDRKLRQIKELDPSVIVSAMDADEAGDKAKDILYSEFKGEIPIRNLKMKEGTDPVDLTRKQVKRVNRAVQSRVGV
jgi:5S rRNA maturation endonuclease (ribonuclease M5)